MFKLSREKQFAEGYPATHKVAARALRKRGPFGQIESIYLVNGHRAFQLRVSDVETLRIVKKEDGSGVYAIHGGPAGSQKEIADFGSEKTAKRAVEAVVAARSGIRIGGMPVLVKLPLYGLGVFLLAAAFGGAQTATPAAPSVVGAAAAGASADPSKRFDPNEPMLEQLASGNYRFEPRVNAPEVQAPVLSCAKPGQAG